MGGEAAANTNGSALFSAMGLGSLDLGILILIMLLMIIALFVTVMVQINRQKELKRRYSRFMQGKKAQSLEDQFAGLFQDVARLKKESKAYANDIDLLFTKHETALQKAGIVKYDAFKEMGGELSFSLAILDEHDDGFVLNSVHSSNGCYSYTKRIRGGECDTDLSEEEREAIRRAREGK